jgi:eukaryotic-like serine/threonine-protein kinase
MTDERTQSTKRGSLESDSAASSATNRDGAQGDERPNELLPGAALGRYAVLEQLGAGAMGIVYAAYDGKLERKVAIKVVKFDRRDQGSRDNGVPRLLREAQALARLAHPNVVPIYDVGSQGDRMFLAMELIEGRTLREWLDRRPRGWREIVALMIQAGRGLAAAHAAQIVHRDFKPDNVLVRAAEGDGRDDHAWVTDFGLARGMQDEMEPISNPIDSHDSLSRTLTRTGSVMGTPGYMAPEQHFGRPAEPRSDQYAFCVTLYEALYGMRPFSAVGLEAVARLKWTNTVAEPGSARPSGMPEELHRLILRGLDRDPERRFASMNELVGRLEALLVHRSRAPWIAAAAVVALVAGTWVWSSRPSRCPDAQAQLDGVWDRERAAEVERAYATAGTRASETMWPRVQSRLDEYAAQWVVVHRQLCEHGGSAAGLDAGMSCLRARRGELAAVVEVLRTADRGTVHASLELLDSLVPIEGCAEHDDPIADPEREALRAPVADEVAATRAHVEGVQLARAIALGETALAHARALGDIELVGEAELQLGIATARSGRFDEAERYYTDAFWAAREHGLDTLAFAAARRMVFLLASDLEDVDRAEQWVRHAEAQLARIGAYETSEHASLLQNTALMYGERGDMVLAEQALRHALEIRKRTEPDDSRDASMLRNNLGTMLSAQGRLEEALAMHALARANRVARLGPVHPEVAMSDINLAQVLALAGRNHEALARIERARPIIAETLGEFTPMMSTLHSIRGAVWMYLGRNELALLDFDAVLVFRITRLGADHRSVGSAWNLIAAALDRPADGDVALRFFHRALAIQETAGGSSSTEAILTRMNIGMTLLRVGRATEAAPIVRAAYEDLMKRRPAAHPDVAQATISMARIEIAIGHYELALELLEQARKLDRTIGLSSIERPTTKFQRARALWELDRDRVAAHAMVREARALVAADADSRTAELSAIDEWLTAHPRPPDPR